MTESDIDFDQNDHDHDDHGVDEVAGSNFRLGSYKHREIRDGYLFRDSTKIFR